MSIKIVFILRNPDTGTEYFLDKYSIVAFERQGNKSFVRSIWMQPVRFRNRYTPWRNMKESWQKRWFQRILTRFKTFWHKFQHGSLWEYLFTFLKVLQKLQYLVKKLIIYKFSKYKGDPNDVENFLNIFLFVVETLIFSIFLLFIICIKILNFLMSFRSPLYPEK